MAGVAFDAATGANPFATSASFSHTTSGSNRLLLVGIVFNNDPGSTPTATYNGVSMTLIASRSDTMWAYVWALEDPASGTNTVAISWTNTRATAIGAISVKDCTGGTPKYNHVVTESDGDESIDIPTDHSSDMAIVIAVQPGSGTPLATPPGTERLSQSGSFGGQTLQISTDPGTGAPVTMAYTSVGTSTFLVGVNAIGPSTFVPYPNPISGRSGPFHKVQL